MEHKDKNSGFGSKFILWIGYYWVIFSVIIAIWQLADFLFDLKPLAYSVSWVILIGIFVGSGLCAFVLVKFFPSIIDVIDNITDRRTEYEKYFKVKRGSGKNFLISTIVASIPCAEDDQFLLAPLKEACYGLDSIEPDYVKAVIIAGNNGALFYRLGKNYMRILNGLLALYALNKQNDKGINKNYVYYKNYFIVNDIGWSLTELNEEDFKALHTFWDKEINDKGELISSFIDTTITIEWDRSAKDNGEKLILKARKELEKLNNAKYAKLYAQALRHCMSFQMSKTDYELQELFKKAIKSIKNKRDRAEMTGNMEFIKAIMVFRNEQATEEQIKSALESLEKAQQEYKSIDDTSRFVKCYNIEGKLLLKLKDKSKAIDKFKAGLNTSKQISRYDQVFLNLQSLVELNEGEDAEKYAKEGLSLSIKLKNAKFESIFRRYAKVKHVFLIRHGESFKNLNKTINGEGNLTKTGKKQISDIGAEISDYMSHYGYSTESIKLYGIEKTQIKQSMEIITENLRIPQSNIIYSNELLKPLNMGILAKKKENEHTDDESIENALIVLNRWRNGMISAKDLNIPEMEKFESYWKRAEEFFKLIKNNDVSVVVCTTSIAVLLTQYFLNPNMTDSEYKCLDFPLGGIVHFIEVPNNEKYKLMNKDTRTNIQYSSIDTL